MQKHIFFLEIMPLHAVSSVHVTAATVLINNHVPNLHKYLICMDIHSSVHMTAAIVLKNVQHQICINNQYAWTKSDPYTHDGRHGMYNNMNVCIHYA